ncbi:MAG TPA: KH domain-containing protein [Candidatus Saccharimonadia bacterium]
MADLREDFVQYVVKALVNNPEAVTLGRNQDEKGEYLELRVDPSDMGKVIGKAGATAKSIRTLLRGVGAKDDLPPLPLKIVDPERSEHDTRDHAPVAAAATAAGATESAAETSVEEAAPTPEEKDEHQALHERTKREMQELADFEL